MSNHKYTSTIFIKPLQDRKKCETFSKLTKETEKEIPNSHKFNNLRDTEDLHPSEHKKKF